jgi:hypothetical protein
MIFIGKVIDREDPDGGKRIRVRLKTPDANISDDNLPYAFPLLPKFLHIQPKVGEAVVVVCENDDPRLQRFYLGPIISQYQKLYKDNYDTGALGMIFGKHGKIFPSIDNIKDTFGAFCEDDDVTLYGRKYSDIILSDDNIRIRCGAKLPNATDTTVIGYNRTNPAVIKLKYHESPITTEKPLWNKVDGTFGDKTKPTTVESSVNLIGQEINLISTNGDPYVNTADIKESLSDEELSRFINKAHPIPYGDKLLQYLHVLVEAFLNHTHKYSQMKPVEDITMIALKKFETDTILSKNIRIN